MRVLWFCGAFTALATHVALSGAAELESGLAVGDSVSAFQVVKQGGVDDGVEVGKKLCYR